MIRKELGGFSEKAAAVAEATSSEPSLSHHLTGNPEHDGAPPVSDEYDRPREPADSLLEIHAPGYFEARPPYPDLVSTPGTPGLAQPAAGAASPHRGRDPQPRHRQPRGPRG